MVNATEVIVRKINPRDVVVYLSHRGPDARCGGIHVVRLVHKPTGLQGTGEGHDIEGARAAADADFATHLKAAGLEL